MGHNWIQLVQPHHGGLTVLGHQLRHLGAVPQLRVVWWCVERKMWVVG
jgi:hypothetical protein